MPNKKCPECGSNDIMFIGEKEGEDIVGVRELRERVEGIEPCCFTSFS